MKKIVLIAFSFVIACSVNAQKLVKKLDNAHVGEIISLAINNDGTWLLTGGVDKRSYIWETASGKKLKAFGSHSDKVTAVAFNNSSKLFATAGADKRIIVWNSADGKPKAILSGHTNAISSVAFNPLSDAMVSSDIDGKILVWDESNKVLGTLSGHAKAVTGVAYSPDGKYVASGSLDNTIKIWDTQSLTESKSITLDVKGIKSVAYSNDGRYVAAGCINGSIVVCDARSGNVLMTLSDLNGAVNAVCFSPDVQYVAGAGDDSKISFYSLESQQLVKQLPAHAKGITAIVFSDKNNQFASAGNDASIMIWDVEGLNIGKKKVIAADNSTGTPKITCSALTLRENNSNGIIEQGDNAVLSFTVKNEGKGQAYDLSAVPELTSAVKGIIFDKEYSIGNLAPGKSQKIEIPVTVTDDLETAASTFKIGVIEANGNNAAPIVLDFQTKGSVNAYIMITGFDYTSPTGKAELTTPITLKLKLRNLTNGKATNIKVSFKLPANVIATDKLSETFAEIEANGVREASVTFYADKTYTLDTIAVKAEIENAYSSNVKDINLTLKVGKELPVSPELLAAAPAEEAHAQMRGGADPLKGLNVAKAQTQMSVGDYYALIIGIDKYKGAWSPLKNAVADAKAVESMMRTKYKFEHFKVLYNEQATRENIINEMEWLVANVKAKDNVLIYYSGHGDFKQELNKGYWVPVDAESASTSKFISNSDIQTFLGGIKSKHTLLVSDACFSGDLFRGNTVSVPFESTDKYYIKVNDLTSRQAISSGGIEPVMDGGKDGHSVFAYYFLKALENNQNKYLDAGQLYDKVRVPVVNNSEQSPNFSPIKNTGDEGGQFIFIKK